VNGRSIDQFLGNDSCKQLDKADLSAVKSALESVSGRASDFVQTSQLKIQQIMQTYNIAVSMINSLQSMGAEANKSIAQAIR
ncbi:MAG TPA: secretion protein EspA, partial [Trinickia sp.]|nr:secretion protein EspA [Trinickia sp.]